MSTRSGPRPRSLLRRIERWMMGLVMGALAFAIEKAVLRSIKKGGAKGVPAEPAQPFATSRGTDVGA